MSEFGLHGKPVRSRKPTFVKVDVNPRVVVPTPEAGRHGFGVDLTKEEVKRLSEELTKATDARISKGVSSPAEDRFYAEAEKLF